MANPTPIQEAAKLGQSIWYDNLRRSMLKTGELAKLIEQDGLRGMTSNPSIFEKAIGSSHDYDDAVAELAAKDSSLDDLGLFEHLAVEDIQGACDAFRKLYDATGGKDGFVSLEVSPRRAHDTAETVKEAKRLHAAVNRPNVMIKVPGTKEGVPAIQQLIAAGISVNTTLLFAVDAYLAAAEAYISGLEERRARGGDITKVAGVASFFLSRIDTMVDDKLDKLGSPAAAQLKGKTAIANAKLAYADYHALIAGARWKALAAAGAQPQRLLWASTGTKNPAFPKLMYVEALIGKDTVNTIPTDTYNEFRDHGTGHVAAKLDQDLDGAIHQLAKLAELGISLREVTDKLLDDGTAAFVKSFDTLLDAVKSKRTHVAGK
jgi:transaldolase